MQPAARPRPRGQALGQEPAREDAGAPLKRHEPVSITIFHRVSDALNLDLGFNHTSKFKASPTRIRETTIIRYQPLPTVFHSGVECDEHASRRDEIDRHNDKMKIRIPLFLLLRATSPPVDSASRWIYTNPPPVEDVHERQRSSPPRG